MRFILGFEKITPKWLPNIGVTEKKSWWRLGTSERSLWRWVKNMVPRMCRERHTGSFSLEPAALLWEMNEMKLQALMDEPRAITGTYASHVQLMCKTYQTYPYFRVVTRYMGSGIKGLKLGGIQDHSPRDRDQWGFHWTRIRDSLHKKFMMCTWTGFFVKLLEILWSISHSNPRYWTSWLIDDRRPEPESTC